MFAGNPEIPTAQLHSRGDLSTTSQNQAIDKVYEQGANYYIRKPNTFAMLKEVIERMLEIDWSTHQRQTPKENFVLNKNG